VYVNGQFDNQIYLRDLSARKFLQLPALSSCNHSDEEMHTKESSEFAFRILQGCITDPHHASLYHFI
jgi:hypothetical protein